MKTLREAIIQPVMGASTVASKTLYMAVALAVEDAMIMAILQSLQQSEYESLVMPFIAGVGASVKAVNSGKAG